MSGWTLIDIGGQSIEVYIYDQLRHDVLLWSDALCQLKGALDFADGWVRLCAQRYVVKEVLM